MWIAEADYSRYWPLIDMIFNMNVFSFANFDYFLLLTTRPLSLASEFIYSLFISKKELFLF